MIIFFICVFYLCFSVHFELLLFWFVVFFLLNRLFVELHLFMVTPPTLFFSNKELGIIKTGDDERGLRGGPHDFFSQVFTINFTLLTNAGLFPDDLSPPWGCGRQAPALRLPRASGGAGGGRRAPKPSGTVHVWAGAPADQVPLHAAPPVGGQTFAEQTAGLGMWILPAIRPVIEKWKEWCAPQKDF